MPYRIINIELETREQLFDLYYPIELFKQFVSKLESHIQGTNFNKYYDPERGNIHPTLQFRFFSEEELDNLLLPLCIDLVERNVIRAFRLDMAPWIEPAFVVKAHELGTLCAVNLVSSLSENKALISSLGNRIIEFFALFMISLLRDMGYELDFVWGQIRTKPVTDEAMTLLTSPLTEQLRSRLSAGDLTPSFLERFTHAFFNCTIQPAESLFRSLLSEYFFWTNLMDRRQ